MSVYALGDVQGCYGPLRRLLDLLGFDPAHDVALFAGDLVNRGPQSLETLRFVRSLGSAARCVLGNHDIHLLAMAAGARQPRPDDTASSVLDASDAEELIAWLRRQPLLYRAQGWTMVHAGLPPAWGVDRAEQLAREFADFLQAPAGRDQLRSLYGDAPECWRDDLSGEARLRMIANYFTRMRFCTAEGRLDLRSGPPGSVCAPFLPWFAHPHRAARDERILFGHWASLNGESFGVPNVYPLDTGCVWGRRLRAMRLEDLRLFHVEAD